MSNGDGNDWGNPPNQGPPNQGPPNGPPGQGPSGGNQSMPSQGPPGQGGPNQQMQPTGQPPGGGGGGNALTEGWGDSDQFDLDWLLSNIKLAARRFMGPILMAWVGIAIVVLVLSLVSSLVWAIGDLTDVDILLTLSNLLDWIDELVYFLGGAAQLALYRPLRDEMFGGQGTVPSAGRAIGSARGRILPVLGVFLLLSIGTAIVACTVIGPFALMFFFAQAIYWAATSEAGVVDSFKRSFELAKRYWPTMAAAVAVVVIASTVGGCLRGILTFIIHLVNDIFAPFDEMFIDLFAWVGIELGLLIAFVAWAGVFATIEEKATGERVVK